MSIKWAVYWYIQEYKLFSLRLSIWHFIKRTPMSWLVDIFHRDQLVMPNLQELKVVFVSSEINTGPPITVRARKKEEVYFHKHQKRLFPNRGRIPRDLRKRGSKKTSFGRNPGVGTWLGCQEDGRDRGEDGSRPRSLTYWRSGWSRRRFSLPDCSPRHRSVLSLSFASLCTFL